METQKKARLAEKPGSKITYEFSQNNYIDILLSRLSGVKRTGPGRYIAKCPAHDDRSPSLAVSEKNGNVLLHCFSGCAPADVLAAAGLQFSDLYPKRPPYTRRGADRINPSDVLRCLTSDGLIIALAAEQIAVGKTVSPTDAERIQAAHSRIWNAARYMGMRI